jgi:hypothetical protein
MAVLYTQHFVQFFDDNGNPLSGGRLYTYDAGGTTPKATYTDAAGSTANANPVVLDAAGRATVFLYGTTYRFDLKTSGDVLVRSTDNIQSFGVVQSNIQNSNLALMPATTVKANALISSATPTDVSFETFAYLLNLPSGMQNMFRNPFMEVAQRGTSGTITAGTGAYTLDGWAVTASGGSVSWQQAGSVLSGSTYSTTSLGLLGSSGLTACGMYQRIESNMAGQISGRRVTVQFVISNQTGASITPTIATYYPTATDNYTSVVSDLGVTSLQTIASGATATVAYTFVTNSLGSRGYGFDLNFGSQLNGAGKNVYISAADIRVTPDAPLGLNNAPPRPEYRPIPTEIGLCEWYLETGRVYGYGYAGSAGNYRAAYRPFRRRKRTASPAVIVSNITYGGAGANSLVVEQVDSTFFGARVTTTTSGSFVVDFDFLASSEL